ESTPNLSPDIPVPAHEIAHIESVIAAGMRQQGTITDCHRLRAYQHVDNGFTPGICLSFHCRMDGNTTLEAAHNASVQLEQLLRLQLPALGRIVIHMEPLV
ncbi:MAG: cation transporter dimerization domain-containing protein, partial [Desulfovibrionaceae bacterium]